ncbi:ClbS/DfsB family four-helix bundle protein [Lacticaseibacillus jixiensis]|uniref:ClbS/DfsB family four-helix bundle protein n=1 Tax=Lacticaseibacillus jixiensis TaxID=3231926 RepID=UPI0036F33F43
MSINSRQELLVATRTRFDHLEAQLRALPADGKTATFQFKGRDRNVRDVLVHLTAWQEMYLHWSQTNLAGEKRVRFLPQPYTWADCGKLSKKIQAANQDVTYEDALKHLRRSHRALIDQFTKLTQEQLFVPGFFNWTGSSPLGEYATLFSARRYAWANKVLHRFSQQLAAQQQAVTQ